MTSGTSIRAPALRRGLALAAIAAGVPAAAAPAVRAAPTPPAASQALVVLLGDHAARTAPASSAHRLGSVSARRPLTGVHTVLPLIASTTDAAGDRWLHVRLPGRPSGHTGWISADATRRTATPYAIVVRLSLRRVTAYDQGRAVRRFRATIGKPSTPTPRGSFFVEEAAALRPGASGGPFALAASARSRVLQEFDGGPGQIALHGTGRLAGGLGRAISHGCVRLSTAAITWLARRVGAGVPLRIED
jgi:lipoprotein-anchoring transpeptidase ErfK/SrfK